MLLASLESKNVRFVSVHVERLADQTSRNAAHVFVARSDEAGIRAPVSDRDAEALRLARHNLGAPSRRSLQRRKGECFSDDPDQHCSALARGRLYAVVRCVDVPEKIGRLQS